MSGNDAEMCWDKVRTFLFDLFMNWFVMSDLSPLSFIYMCNGGAMLACIIAVLICVVDHVKAH